ncbi:MAG: hypothetical protein ACOY3K_01500 [Candidatus Omnitrophota bacterium]
MIKKIAIFALLFMVLMATAPVFAASPWTEEDGYYNKVRAKLDFGVKNLMGGWTELYTVPANAEGNVEAITKALGEGLYNTVVYTVGGALHTATALLPGIDVPIKNNGVQFEGDKEAQK